MIVWKVALIALVWLIVSASLCWNGMGWVLSKTSLELLQDGAVKLIVQIITVCLASGTIAGVGTWATMMVLAITGALDD